MTSYRPPQYNPLDYVSISDSLAAALETSPLVTFDRIERFYGDGVYALYYSGSYGPYAPLSEQNDLVPGSWPIYIGKSAPSTRKGASVLGEADACQAGTGLYNRVARNHCKSIEQADNLSVGDFSVRLLVLSPIWVPLAESAMISRYMPLWNTLLDGFGNHAPGKGRAGSKLSVWDTLHPGRPWADAFRADGWDAVVPDLERKVTVFLEERQQISFYPSSEDRQAIY